MPESGLSKKHSTYKLMPIDLLERQQKGLFRTRALRNNNALYFCDNDYLNLSTHPKVIEAFKKAANEYGVGAKASQHVSGYTALHQELEERFATFAGHERALLFGSGYLANLGMIDTFCDRNDLLFQDKDNHASLLDGARFSHAKLLRYHHKDYQHLTTLLEKNTTQQPWIVSDTVFSVTGDLADLPQLATISKTTQYKIIVR